MFPFFRAMTALAVLCLFLAEPAMGAMPPGWGRINMQGAIIETACAIDTGSRYQTIDMATLPFGRGAGAVTGIPYTSGELCTGPNQPGTPGLAALSDYL
ncbi:Uncharacterised protein [Serratia grimesii]|nr:hypothetical protein [Serratia grimesii]CAI0853593.1 Uncharacterised protein [Serratia grimesii]